MHHIDNGGKLGYYSNTEIYAPQLDFVALDYGASEFKVKVRRINSFLVYADIQQ